MEFGYWPIKLRCHYIRWLIAYLGEDYTEINPMNFEEWQEMKKTYYKLNPFINLPFCKEGDFIVSESQGVSLAIILRSGRRDLLGKSGHDVIHHRTIQEIIHNIREWAISLMKNTKEEIKEHFEETAKFKIGFKLQSLKRFMGKKEFLLGYLTLADFELAHCYELYEWICGNCGVKNPFKYFPNLKSIRNRIKRLTGVKEYTKTTKEKNMAWAFPGMAKFETN